MAAVLFIRVHSLCSLQLLIVSFISERVDGALPVLNSASSSWSPVESGSVAEWVPEGARVNVGSRHLRLRHQIERCPPLQPDHPEGNKGGWRRTNRFSERSEAHWHAGRNQRRVRNKESLNPIRKHEWFISATVHGAIIIIIVLYYSIVLFYIYIYYCVTFDMFWQNKL